MIRALLSRFRSDFGEISTGARVAEQPGQLGQAVLAETPYIRRDIESEAAICTPALRQHGARSVMIRALLSHFLSDFGEIWMGDRVCEQPARMVPAVHAAARSSGRQAASDIDHHRLRVHCCRGFACL